MPVLAIHIEDREFQRAIRNLALAGKNMRPVLKAIGQGVVNSTDDRWQKAVDPEGNPWQELSEDWKAKKGHDKILIYTPILRNTITAKLGEDQVEVGTNMIYGPTHQFGRGAMKDKRGRTLPPIPARPFLGFSDDDRQELIETVKDYFEMALGQ